MKNTEENSKKIWKKGKLNSEMIWKIKWWQITSERASSQKIIRLLDTDNENKMAGKGQITGKYGKKVG